MAELSPDLPVQGFLEIIVMEARSLPALNTIISGSISVKAMGQAQVCFVVGVCVGQVSDSFALPNIWQ